MTARAGAGGGVGVLGVIVLSCRLALGMEPMPAEVRVLSNPAPLPNTLVTVRATPDTVVDDQTVGAKPATPGQGAASTGETFRDEITLVLRGLSTSRPAAIEVSDDLVSTVHVVPGEASTTIVIFVRQPVTYTVTPPSPSGEVAVALKGRQPPPGAPVGLHGRRGGGARRPATPETEEIGIDAAELTYDKEHNVVIARGNVTITRGVLTLRADEVHYDRTTSIADASGHVVVTDPDTMLQGDVGHIDMNDESGWLEPGGAEFSATGYGLRSTRLEKGMGPRYHIEDGVFTTCHCGGIETPSWSLGGKTTDVKLNGLGWVHGATFRVMDVPVLWFPVLSFPALSDRATGFLMPRFGYSARRGFQFEQPFFWNISKSQDATVAVDVETAARIGLLAEYRYMLSDEARGSFAGGYWNESIRTSKADEIVSNSGPPPVNRWLVLGSAKQPLSKDVDMYFDAFAVSDDTLLREIRNFSSTLDTGLRLVSARLTKTRLGVIDTWSGGLMQAESDYYQDLIDPQVLAPQRAPYLRAEDSLPLLGNRLVGQLGGQVTDFQRVEGFDGFRGDVSPRLFLPFQVGSALTGSVSGQLHGTMYALGDNRQVGLVVQTASTTKTFKAVNDSNVLPFLDHTHLRGIGQVRAQIGTEFDRVYTFEHFGLEKIRHSIEPDVRYLYVPETDQQLFDVDICRDPSGSGAVLPCREFRFSSNAQRQQSLVRSVFSRGYLFDELDAIDRRNFVSYGITTRILGRAANPADNAPPPQPTGDEDGSMTAPSATPAVLSRELIRFGIRHGFDPSRDINTNSHLADIDLGLRVAPIDYIYLSYDASVNVSDGNLDAQNAALTLNEPGWVAPPHNVYQQASSLSLFYRFVDKNVNLRGTRDDLLFQQIGTQNVGGAFYLRLGNYVGFSAGALYDFGTTTQTVNGKTTTLGPHFTLRDYLLRFISPCQCWAAEFGVSDTFNPNERLYRFSITLLGLGSFGQAPTRRNYGGVILPSLGASRPGAIGFPGESYF
jgi:lipopolysaccharide assembly outer membrane protein LptD (OstA)